MSDDDVDGELDGELNRLDRCQFWTSGLPMTDILQTARFLFFRRLYAEWRLED
ncbi:hypothetical protein [Aurantiacibacter zhengii]|uniref:hypothetical protein n=1 Tax=Aurantiacibacter zhengii TaxID=2307003 RepID=UPI001314FE20|nr:hypothetical protein [Aurantiacibacter zhengii]